MGVTMGPAMHLLLCPTANSNPYLLLLLLLSYHPQARAVLSFLEAVQEKKLRSTLSLTASRGRGKSAAVGLCLAGELVS